jgi:hypothetical protein
LDNPEENDEQFKSGLFLETPCIIITLNAFFSISMGGTGDTEDIEQSRAVRQGVQLHRRVRKDATADWALATNAQQEEQECPGLASHESHRLLWYYSFLDIRVMSSNVKFRLSAEYSLLFHQLNLFCGPHNALAQLIFLVVTISEQD